MQKKIIVNARTFSFWMCLDDRFSFWMCLDDRRIRVRIIFFGLAVKNNVRLMTF
jgi:hypothetical protein